jgi:hypothetical protein
LIIRSLSVDTACSSHQAAAEFSRELFRDCTPGKTPEQVIALVVIVSVPEVDHLNAALSVKRTRRIEPLTEAARWYGNFHDVREITGDDLGA